MNTLGNTPPNGDFASYVERLSAQSALARRTSQADGEHSLEGGPTHQTASSRPGHQNSPEDVGRNDGASQPGATEAKSWRRATHGLAKSPLPVLRPIAPGSSPVPFKVAKVVAVAWLLGLIALFGMGAPFGLLAVVVVAGLWAAGGLRKWALPQGYTRWSAWVQDSLSGRKK